MDRDDRARPKYQLIADDIRTKIEAGSYPPGGQLPTKAALMEHYDVALGTVDRALDTLRALGLTETFQGLGTFVRTRNEEPDESTDLEARVARLEAQMMDVYANLGKSAGAATNQSRREVG